MQVAVVTGVICKFILTIHPNFLCNIFVKVRYAVTPQISVCITHVSALCNVVKHLDC